MRRVCSLERIAIDGVTHHVLVRGPAGAPLLLLVQAGPGLPMICDADALQARLGLEGWFRVAYWDQRGAGRSLDPDTGPLVLEALRQDVVELAAALCGRCEVSTLDLVGFSLGGSLALLAAQSCPCVRHVVAVGPDIDLMESERFAWDFAREQALRRRHRRAARELERIGPPPHDSPERFMTRLKWVANFGGIAIGSSFAGLMAGMVLRLSRSPYYTLPQAFAALRAIRRTQARALGALKGFSLSRLLQRTTAPVTLVQGQLDAAAPARLTEEFFSELEAPHGKRLFMLPDCAHTPHFEVPRRFQEIVLASLGVVREVSGRTLAQV